MNMNQLTKLVSPVLLAAVILAAHHAAAADPLKVRLATLAPKGSSYTKHLQAMGDLWRKAPGGGVALTLYPDGTMGSEADMVRRMSTQTQFIFISHNKIAMEMATQLIGVTMQEKGVSRVVEVDMEEALRMTEEQPA